MFKMVSAFSFVITVLLFQISVKAAPSELLTKLENIATNEQNVKMDSEPNTLAVEDDNNNSTTQQGQRQKRYYNYYGYGFPSINPGIYPNYPREDIPDYGSADPLQQIYRRLQDIAHVVRQPSLPPPPPPQSQFPFFFPVIYVPQIECGCGPDQYVPPDHNIPTTPQTSDRNGTSDLDISNRFPEMEDERQNWGLVNNETVVDDGQEEDFTRPISFVPIRPNRTMIRPPPAVDHGSSQGGGNQGQAPATTTTIRPGPPPQSRPSPPAPNPPQSRPPVPNSPQVRPLVPVEPPSACDGAVLSCCHQREVTYDCFVVQGCPDPTSFGNPCDIQVILRVIDRFQRFYGQRTG